VAAAVAGSPAPEAARLYLACLATPESRASFERFGFTPTP
jgi:hypothetical protein